MTYPNYGPSDSAMVNPVSTGGMNTERWAAVVVIGSLVALVMINRGFRGVSVGRVTGGLVRA